AAAGTGKTYTLEHAVVDEILSGRATIDQILVVTFTDKATVELQARVRQILQRLLDLSGGDDDASDDACWIVDDAARARLAAALVSFDTATISTIHGFCRRVLTEHAFANRQLLEQEHADGRSLFGRAFRDVIRRDVARSRPGRDVLRAVLASGTAFDDIERVVYDVARARARVEPPFDAAAVAAAIAGVDPAAVDSIAGDDRDNDLARALGKARATGDIGGVLAAIDAIGLAAFRKWAERRAAAGAPDAAAWCRLAAVAVTPMAALVQLCWRAAADEFAARKRRTGKFDFDDMLGRVDAALASPQGPALVAALRARYRVAFIDEFQDTDELQWRIFRRVFFESPDGHRLVVIGDPKQAIYSFRGADVHAYLTARAEIEAAGGAVVPLVACYRATGRLIAAYNAILLQDDTPLFTGAIRYDHPVTCGRPEASATDRDGRPVTPIHLFHLGCEDAKYRSRSTDARDALAVRIGQEIRAILDGALLVDGEPVAASDIFVLTRKTNEAAAVGAVLRRLGVPIAFYKQEGLFQTAEAEHILRVLAAIEDPLDRSARYRAWLTPFFDVSLDELERCAAVPGDHPLMQRLFAWKALADHKRFADLFQRVIEDSGIVRRELFFRDSERELTNYLHIFEVLLEHANATRCGLPDLVVELRRRRDDETDRSGTRDNVQRLDTERAAVQIMTLHAAKGLEAKVVFVAGGFSRCGPRAPAYVTVHGDDGARIVHFDPDAKLPGSEETASARAAREASEEDQRLWYVAITRAKARLYLPYFGRFDATGACPAPAAGDLVAINPARDWPIRQLNAQLARIVSGERPVAPGLISREVCVVPGVLPDADGGAVDARAGAWAGPRTVDADAAAPEYADVREAARGPFVTSYSQMKAADAGGFAVAVDGADDEVAGAGADGDGDLPGGRAVGSFLHAAIEQIDLDRVGVSYAQWARDPSVHEVFTAAALRYGIDRAHIARAKRIVHTALTAPVALGDDRLDGGLASAAGRAREMEFSFAVPRAGGGVRGFVRGFIDYVFEHGGKLYFADWKSDALPRYTAGAVRDYAEQRYGLQARVYTLALVKWLGGGAELKQDVYAGRFGGLLYCFVRGMRATGDGTAGIYFARPPFAELLAWQDELYAREVWGPRSEP
ncbi:MAG: hypothetical protein D6689_16065, partial [Deltaproteobacteria bacterium]